MRDLKFADAIAPLYLLLCLLVGGASAAGFFANMALQIGALILLAGFALRLETRRNLLGTRGFAWLVLATVGLVLYQLTPLPPHLWSNLPGRADIVAAYRLLDMPPPALSLSLDPDATIACGLSLLPPLAMAVAVLHASNQSRLLCLMTIIGTAGLSTLVGAIQLSGGSQSFFYFYQVTNSTSSVGFFANSNHLATLFLVSLPCIAALIARDQVAGRSRDVTSRRLALLGLGVLLGFGLLLNRSLAGLGMLVPTVFASYVLWRRGTRKLLPRWQISAGAVVCALLLAFVFAGPVGSRLAEKTLSMKDPVTRRTTNSLTLKAARDYLPFGSGLGTFVAIYPRYEDPQKISTTYVNHAHDDYVELALETGVPGMALLLTWIVWYIRRSKDIWTGEAVAGSLPRAGSVMIAIVAAHSLVDYPARTAAIMAILGCAFGMLASPVAKIAANASGRTTARHAKPD